jgi:tetratricopeptide (TPR) repeat protein
LAQIDKHLAILVAVVLLAVILLAVVATPLGNGLYLRMSNLLTLSARGSLWSAAASLWGTHPVTGLGPGSFPFAYLLTDYFQFSGWDPRNPDNGLVQLITETGMLGVAAAGSVILAVVRGMGSSRQRRLGFWALVVFMVATVGMNPTDFLYLLVISLAWAAMATPPTASVSNIPSRAFPLVRTLAAVCLLVAALLVGTSGIAYDIARSAYQRGDSTASESILRAAALLDPNQAIYSRERAALLLERGDFEGAVAEYRRVLALVPVDEAAKRGLALALANEGESSAALAEIQGAVNRQRFSNRNTLLLAVIASHVGDMSTATRAFEEFLALSPSAALSPRWPISVTGSREKVIEAAVTRGLGNTRASFGLNLTYLALATGNSRLVDLAANAVIPELALSAVSLQSLARCNLAEAWEVIEPAYREEGSNGAYWMTRAIIAMIAETDSAESSELARLYAGAPEQPGAGTMLADGFGDIYKYRRLPFYVQDGLSMQIRTLQEGAPLSVVASGLSATSCRGNP